MIVTFVVPSIARPLGGNIDAYELANGLRRRGHAINIVHVGPLTELRELAWFRFERDITHSFLPLGPIDEAALPRADFIVNPGVSDPGRDERPRAGLPLNYIQGSGQLPKDAEAARWSRPWPKICLATWLLDVARAHGVPEQQIVHVPPGLHHEKYRILTPLDERPLTVSMLYNPQPAKGAKIGIDAIAELKRRVPELHAVLFGIFDMKFELPPDTDYVLDPPQDVLVEQIYNQSRVFLCSSLQEGFGLCGIEAMACGSALVTADTGGSRDFAVHGETALVSEPKDASALADNAELLLRDDATRIALASRGAASTAKFDWDESARILEAYLYEYGRDPSRFRS